MIQKIIFIELEEQLEEQVELDVLFSSFMSMSLHSWDIWNNPKSLQMSMNSQKINLPMSKNNSWNWLRRTIIWTVQPKMATVPISRLTHPIINVIYSTSTHLTLEPSLNLLVLTYLQELTLPSKSQGRPLENTSWRTSWAIREHTKLTTRKVIAEVEIENLLLSLFN